MILRRAFLLTAALAVLAGPAGAQLAPIPQERGGNGLGLALRRIGVTPRVLYVTAHPDDENNGMLVRLSRGQGVRTALLTLTRGDGGQNAIGPELFDALAVLRCEELAAIHRYDGVEQYFGLSSDFGFSFSVDENLDRWGRDAALEDVVRVVRSFRPDVIVTLPLEGPGGGQAHHAAARLARDAFRAAADAARFPEAGAPWQARRIYQGGIGGGNAPAEGALTVRTDVYDPLLGMTWLQFGRAARTLHRSQGTSQVPSSTGGGEATFVLLDGEAAVAGAEADILQGLDLTFPALARFLPGHAKAAPFLEPGLAELQVKVDAARAAYDATQPGKALPPLQRLLLDLRALVSRLAITTLPGDARVELLARLADEEADVESAINRAHGLEVESVVDDDLVVPGQELLVTTTIVNNGSSPIQLEGASLALSRGWSLLQIQGTRPEVGPGERTVYRHRVWVPETAPPSQPDWTRSPGVDRFGAASPALALRPWAPPDVRTSVRYDSGGVLAQVAQSSGPIVVRMEVPAQRRYAWPAGGEKQRVVTVVPPLSVRVEPEITVVPAGSRAPREIRVGVRSHGKEASTTRVRLEAPAGWTVDPPEASLAFRHEDEEKAALFKVTPAAGASGDATLRAVAVDAAGKEHSAGEQVIAYEHIHERRLIRPATARVLSLDVAVPPGLSVGYVDGAGDEVDSAIRQLGVPITYLGADDLAFGDLARFTTIVTGVRAYETRPDLRSYHDRLMRYVEEGGNLVVMYNRTAFNRAGDALPAGTAAPGGVVDSPFAPYPASVGDARVTDENAPPEVLRPDDRLLAAPNRIGAADWKGWVQERGLNFLDARDPRYVDLVAFTDPFPLNPGRKTGALVDAPVGKGRWTYVGLGLFRELPAGVPGAWRLLANLVARPRGK
jgi:LmbE family N-acetylglucosaminyl deacetylase